MNTNIIVASVPGSVELWMLPPYIKIQKLFNLINTKKSYVFMATVISKTEEELSGQIGLYSCATIGDKEHLPLYTPLYNWDSTTDTRLPEELYMSLAVYESKYVITDTAELISNIAKDPVYRGLTTNLSSIVASTVDSLFLQNLIVNIEDVATRYLQEWNTKRVTSVSNHFSIPARTLARTSIDTVSVSTPGIDLKFELLVSDMISNKKEEDCQTAFLYSLLPI